jgi:phosphatidylserine decarboxylase
MGIVSEGIKLIVIGLTVAVVGFILFISLGFLKWLSFLLMVLGLLFSLFTLYFFRDPTRNRIFAPLDIACPADGTVLSVQTENNPNEMVIRIFLSIFNVHLQRSPLDGQVQFVQYTKGNFNIAYKPEALTNERNSIRILGKDGRYAEVEQIAGAIARRIACYVQAELDVKIGQKIGMIYFGSHVALRLPVGTRIFVKPGDKVYAGETVIGLW